MKERVSERGHVIVADPATDHGGSLHKRTDASVSETGALKK